MDTSEHIQAALRKLSLPPFCDIKIKVEDGKPVHIELTTKHKP